MAAQNTRFYNYAFFGSRELKQTCLSLVPSLCTDSGLHELTSNGCS